MADNRTKRQKLLAMASQTASPAEAEIARMLLTRLDPDHESNRALTRDDILGAPDRSTLQGTVRFQTSSGYWVTMDLDEMEVVAEVKDITGPSYIADD